MYVAVTRAREIYYLLKRVADYCGVAFVSTNFAIC